MEKLIILNSQVKTLLGVNIHYNMSINNFKINGYWVTDVNHFHFAQFEKSFKKLIDNNINRDSEKEVVFLKNIQEDLKKNQSFLNKIDFDKIQEFCSSIDLKYPEQPPAYNTRDLAEVTPWNNEGRQSYIKEILLSYLSEDGYNDNRFDEKNWNEIDKLLIDKGLFVDELYGIAHLMIIVSYQIELIQKVIDYIQSYLDTLKKMGINYWEKDELIESPNYSGHLHFNMSKKQVALFFHTFHQLGLIYGDFEKKEISQTRMTQFLSAGGFFYVDRSKNLKPLIKLNKEFGDFYDYGGAPTKINDFELDYLQSLIDRIQERKEFLEKERKEYIDRQKTKAGRMI